MFIDTIKFIVAWCLADIMILIATVLTLPGITFKFLKDDLKLGVVGALIAKGWMYVYSFYAMIGRLTGFSKQYTGWKAFFHMVSVWSFCIGTTILSYWWNPTFGLISICSTSFKIVGDIVMYGWMKVQYKKCNVEGMTKIHLTILGGVLLSVGFIKGILKARELLSAKRESVVRRTLALASLLATVVEAMGYDKESREMNSATQVMSFYAKSISELLGDQRELSYSRKWLEERGSKVGDCSGFCTECLDKSGCCEHKFEAWITPRIADHFVKNGEIDITPRRYCKIAPLAYLEGEAADKYIKDHATEFAGMVCNDKAGLGAIPPCPFCAVVSSKINHRLMSGIEGVLNPYASYVENAYQDHDDPYTLTDAELLLKVKDQDRAAAQVDRIEAIIEEQTTDVTDAIEKNGLFYGWTMDMTPKLNKVKNFLSRFFGMYGKHMVLVFAAFIAVGLAVLTLKLGERRRKRYQQMREAKGKTKHAFRGKSKKVDKRFRGFNLEKIYMLGLAEAFWAANAVGDETQMKRIGKTFNRYGFASIEDVEAYYDTHDDYDSDQEWDEDEEEIDDDTLLANDFDNRARVGGGRTYDDYLNGDYAGRADSKYKGSRVNEVVREPGFYPEKKEKKKPNFVPHKVEECDTDDDDDSDSEESNVKDDKAEETVPPFTHFEKNGRACAKCSSLIKTKNPKVRYCRKCQNKKAKELKHKKTKKDVEVKPKINTVDRSKLKFVKKEGREAPQRGSYFISTGKPVKGCFPCILGDSQETIIATTSTVVLDSTLGNKRLLVMPEHFLRFSSIAIPTTYDGKTKIYSNFVDLELEDFIPSKDKLDDICTLDVTKYNLPFPAMKFSEAQKIDEKVNLVVHEWAHSGDGIMLNDVFISASRRPSKAQRPNEFLVDYTSEEGHCGNPVIGSEGIVYGYHVGTHGQDQGNLFRKWSLITCPMELASQQNPQKEAKNQ